MSFAIVDFFGSKEAEVPASWFDDGTCCWPGGRTERIVQLAKASTRPSEAWARHAAKVKGLFCKF